MASRRIKNILIVKKSMRFDRLAGVNRVVQEDATHKNQNSSSHAPDRMDTQSHDPDCNASLGLFRRNFSHKVLESQNQHNEIADAFHHMLKQNKNWRVESIREVDVTFEEMQDRDLCITLGGDNTFLKAASTISNSERTAIMGVNSQPKL